MTSFHPYSAANHFRHPWFDTGVMKRKQPIPLNVNEDMDDEDDSEARPTKRRRCTGLENGIAHLSLDTSAAGGNAHRSWGTVPIVTEEHDRSLSTSPSITTSDVSYSLSPGDQQTVVLPGSIEEPSSVPEVKMGSSSWYEPERDRIVITDLDGYADEELSSDDDGSGLTVTELESLPSSGVSVNPVLLERLRTGQAMMEPLPKMASDDSRALVLFRPLLPVQTERSRSPSPQLDDAMDLDL